MSKEELWGKNSGWGVFCCWPLRLQREIGRGKDEKNADSYAGLTSKYNRLNDQLNGKLKGSGKQPGDGSIRQRITTAS